VPWHWRWQKRAAVRDYRSTSDVRVRLFPNERVLAQMLASDVAATLVAKPDLVLGLPTGRTPLILYEELSALAGAGQADLSQATTFNLDEFLGLPADHPGSYRQYMDAHLFRRVPSGPAHIHFLDGAARDVDAECRRYEVAIADAGGIDLQILGIGSNGHIGFNEPGPHLIARTHRVVLRPETRRANLALFGGVLEHVPTEALSMGMATILQARRLVLLATGRSKAACVRGMIDGPLTTLLPASFLQLHRDTEVLLDEAAAHG
jgi:glucosamine-6-phosphate deaminase